MSPNTIIAQRRHRKRYLSFLMTTMLMHVSCSLLWLPLMAWTVWLLSQTTSEIIKIGTERKEKGGFQTKKQNGSNAGWKLREKSWRQHTLADVLKKLTVFQCNKTLVCSTPLITFRSGVSSLSDPECYPTVTRTNEDLPRWYTLLKWCQ